MGHDTTAASQARRRHPLAAITYRISSTVPKHLPLAIPHLAHSLLDCRQLLSAPSDTIKRDSIDGVSLHKYKTQVTSLLNGKVSEGRWAAAVLIKTTIDAGGWEILRDAGKWVRGLLSILQKPDKPATKKVAIIALAKVFLRAHEYPTVERELATPSIPPFLTACMNIISAEATAANKLGHVATRHALAETIFESLALLLPLYSTTFRPFQAQIQRELAHYIAPTSAGVHRGSVPVPLRLENSAQKVWTLLPFCAATTRRAEEWSKAVLNTIEDLHAITSIIYRPVVEVWRSSCAVVPRPVPLDSIPQHDGAGALSLPPWEGILDGCKRLTGLLSLLRMFLSTQTSTKTSLPTARIIDLVTRLVLVTVPSPNSKGSKSDLTNNAQIGRDEREELFASLPAIHAASIEVTHALVARLGQADLQIASAVFDLTTWTYESGTFDAELKSACYRIMENALSKHGSAFSKDTARSLDKMIRGACSDLAMLGGDSTAKASQPNGTAKTTLNADSILKSSPASTRQDIQSPRKSSLEESATKFLSVCLSKLNPRHISSSTRVLIDRTCILTRKAEIMFASVLSPSVSSEGAKTQSSILPFLAQSQTREVNVEALLRPRMPLIPPTDNSQLLDEEDEDEDEDEGEEDEEMEEVDGGEDEEEKSEAVAQDNAIKISKGIGTSTLVQDSMELPTKNDEAFVVRKRTAPLEPPESSIGKRARTEDTAMAAPVQTTSQPIPAPAVIEQEDDSDSDDGLVMPPLTLEPDTEDEEDEST